MSKRVMPTRFPSRRGPVAGLVVTPNHAWQLCVFCQHKIPVKDRAYHVQTAHPAQWAQEQQNQDRAEGRVSHA